MYIFHSLISASYMRSFSGFLTCLGPYLLTYIRYSLQYRISNSCYVIFELLFWKEKMYAERSWEKKQCMLIFERLLQVNWPVVATQHSDMKDWFLRTPAHQFCNILCLKQELLTKPQISGLTSESITQCSPSNDDIDCPSIFGRNNIVISSLGYCLFLTSLWETE